MGAAGGGSYFGLATDLPTRCARAPPPTALSLPLRRHVRQCGRGRPAPPPAATFSWSSTRTRETTAMPPRSWPAPRRRCATPARASDARLTADEAELAAVVRGAADRRIVLAGGDGTVHALANLDLPALPPTALLPAGRANNIARALGIPVDWRAAARLAVRGRPAAIDALHVVTPERSAVRGRGRQRRLPRRRAAPLRRHELRRPRGRRARARRRAARVPPAPRRAARRRRAAVRRARRPALPLEPPLLRLRLPRRPDGRPVRRPARGDRARGGDAPRRRPDAGGRARRPPPRAPGRRPGAARRARSWSSRSRSSPTPSRSASRPPAVTVAARAPAAGRPGSVRP